MLKSFLEEHSIFVFIFQDKNGSFLENRQNFIYFLYNPSLIDHTVWFFCFGQRKNSITELTLPSEKIRTHCALQLKLTWNLIPYMNFWRSKHRCCIHIVLVTPKSSEEFQEFALH